MKRALFALAAWTLAACTTSSGRSAEDGGDASLHDSAAPDGNGAGATLEAGFDASLDAGADTANSGDCPTRVPIPTAPCPVDGVSCRYDCQMVATCADEAGALTWVVDEPDAACED